MHSGTTWSAHDAGVGRLLYSVVAQHRTRDAKARVARERDERRDAGLDAVPDADLPHLQLLRLAEQEPSPTPPSSPDSPTARGARQAALIDEGADRIAATNAGLTGTCPPSLLQISRGGLHPTEGATNYNSMLRAIELHNRFGAGMSWKEVVVGPGMAAQPPPGAAFSPFDENPAAGERAATEMLAASRRAGSPPARQQAAAAARGTGRTGRIARPWNEDPANSEVHDAGLQVRRVPRGEPVASVARKAPVLSGDNDGATTDGTLTAAGANAGHGPIAEGIHFGKIPDIVINDVASTRDTRMLHLRDWRREVAVAHTEEPRYSTGAGGDPVLLHMSQQAALNREEDEVVKANITAMSRFLGGNAIEDPNRYPRHAGQAGKTAKQTIAELAAKRGSHNRTYEFRQAARERQRQAAIQAARDAALAASPTKRAAVPAGRNAASPSSPRDAPDESLMITANNARSELRRVFADLDRMEHEAEETARGEMHRTAVGVGITNAGGGEGSSGDGAQPATNTATTSSSRGRLPLVELRLETAVVAEEDLPYLHSSGVRFFDEGGQLAVAGGPSSDDDFDDDEVVEEYDDEDEDAGAADDHDDDEDGADPAAELQRIGEEFEVGEPFEIQDSDGNVYVVVKTESGEIVPFSLEGDDDESDTDEGRDGDVMDASVSNALSSDATDEGAAGSGSQKSSPRRRRGKGRAAAGKAAGAKPSLLFGNSVLSFAKRQTRVEALAAPTSPDRLDTSATRQQRDGSAARGGGSQERALVARPSSNQPSGHDDETAQRPAAEPMSTGGADRYGSGISALLARRRMHDDSDDPAVVIADATRRLETIFGPLHAAADDIPTPVDVSDASGAAQVFEESPRQKWLADILSTLRDVEVAVVAAQQQDDEPQPQSAGDVAADTTIATEGTDAPAAATISNTDDEKPAAPGERPLPRGTIDPTLDPRERKSRKLAWVDEQLCRYVEELVVAATEAHEAALERHREVAGDQQEGSQAAASDEGEPTSPTSTDAAASPELTAAVASLERAVAGLNDARALTPVAECFCAIGGHILRQPCAAVPALRSLPIDDTAPFPPSALDPEECIDDDRRVVLVDRPSWSYVQLTRANDECEDETAWSSTLLCLEPQPLPSLEARIWRWRRRVVRHVAAALSERIQAGSMLRSLLNKCVDEVELRGELAAAGHDVAVTPFARSRMLTSTAVETTQPFDVVIKRGKTGNPPVPATTGSTAEAAKGRILQHAITVPVGRAKPVWTLDMDFLRNRASAAYRSILAAAERRTQLATIGSVLTGALATIDMEAAGCTRDCMRGAIAELPCPELAVRGAIVKGLKLGMGLDQSELIATAPDIVSLELRDAEWIMRIPDEHTGEDRTVLISDSKQSLFRKLRGLHELTRRVTLLLQWVEAMDHMCVQTMTRHAAIVLEYNAVAREYQAFRRRMHTEWASRFTDTLRCSYTVLAMIKIGSVTAAGNMDLLTKVARFLCIEPNELLSSIPKHHAELERMVRDRNLRASTVEWNGPEFKNFSEEAVASDCEPVPPLQLLPLPALFPAPVYSVAADIQAQLASWLAAALPSLASVPRSAPTDQGARTGKSPAGGSGARDRLPLVTTKTTDDGDGDDDGGDDGDAQAERELLESMQAMDPTTLAITYADLLPYRDALRLERARRMTLLRSERAKISLNPTHRADGGGSHVTVTHASSPEEQRKLAVAARVLSAMSPAWSNDLAAGLLATQASDAEAMAQENRDDKALRERTLARPVGEDRRVPWWHFTPPTYFTGDDKKAPQGSHSTANQQQQQLAGRGAAATVRAAPPGGSAMRAPPRRLPVAALTARPAKANSARQPPAARPPAAPAGKTGGGLRHQHRHHQQQQPQPQASAA